MENIPTPHNEAAPNDFADTVLMPGDPLRAKFIAENYLNSIRLVNNIRGVQGYTGAYKGKSVSVMASGMGQPSIAIYSYELFKFYNVNNIIRVGSIGALRKNIELGDLIIATNCSTDSNFYKPFGFDGNHITNVNFELFKRAYKEAVNAKYPFHYGHIISSDHFYAPDDIVNKWIKKGCIGVEMESAVLYFNATRLNKKALTICSVSNNLLVPENTLSDNDWKDSVNKMVTLALETVIHI